MPKGFAAKKAKTAKNRSVEYLKYRCNECNYECFSRDLRGVRLIGKLHQKKCCPQKKQIDCPDTIAVNMNQGTTNGQSIFQR